MDDLGVRTNRFRALRTLSCMTLAVGMSLAAAQSQSPTEPMVFEGAAGGARLLEEGQELAMVHPTVEDARRAQENGIRPRGQTTTASGGNLSYHGGTGGIGVETAPKVYLVLWGSQWNSNDPSGEAAILESFYMGVGGSAWSNTVTQYCQGVPSGTIFCDGAGTPAGNPAGIYAGVFVDNSAAAPTHPRQSQIASEAVRAAQFFGNTRSGSNKSTQYVIATATRNSSSGFGRSYCAYHSSTRASSGKIAYTNLPYQTDAGASCGAGFNGLGATAGITIVAGHEMAETMTDQFPSTGWLDSTGSEIGDKCAWISSGQGAAAMVTFPNGSSFPVQSLFSNAFNGGAGDCVLSYP